MLTKLRDRIMRAGMRWRLYRWITHRVVPKIRLSWGYTGMSEAAFWDGEWHWQPGDIILTSDRAKLSTKLIPGTFPHAMLAVGKKLPELGVGHGGFIAQMTSKGYSEIGWYETCKESDRVLICRCRDWDYRYVTRVVVPTCRSFANKQYDLAFELTRQSLYCSELIYQADPERRLQLNMTDVLGMPMVLADDLLAAENVDVVWDSQWVDKTP